jgi:Protein of unknown function (DUF3102)
MSSAPQNQSFDYSALDDETRAIIQGCSQEIQTRMLKTVEEMIAIGNHLLTVKQKLKHGQFHNWLISELGMHPRQANRFILVSQQFKHDIMSRLNIAPTALYLLAELKTPEEARKEAIRRAKQGESITVNIAKNIVSHHKTTSTVNLNQGQGGSVSKQSKTDKYAVLKSAPSAVAELSMNDSHPEISLESINSEISSHESDKLPEYIDVEAITLPNDLEKDMDLETQKSFGVGDRIRITRREQGPDKWSGKIAKIWEITDGGWLRINVEGHKGVKFTLHPDWVVPFEKSEMTEQSKAATLSDSGSLEPEQAIQVSISLIIEGELVQVEGVVHEVDVHYMHQGVARTARVPANHVVVAKSL